MYKRQAAKQCRANLQSTDNIDFIIDTLEETENGIIVDLSVTNVGNEDFTLMWQDDCVIRSNVMRNDGSATSSSTTACDIFDSYSTLKTGDSINILNLPIELLLNDESVAGTHFIQFNLRSYPPLEIEYTHNIAMLDNEDSSSEETIESNDEDVQTENQEELRIYTLLEGTWNHVRTDTGGCWILTTPTGDETVLVGSDDITLNEWIGPYKSSFGHHIIKVNQSSPGFYPLITEVLNKVEVDLLNENKDKAVNKYIEEVKSEYTIFVNQNL